MTTQKVNSRAEDMITDVEKLYEFGVHVGLLPEDCDLKSSLRRMKGRFQGLSRPALGGDGEFSQQLETHGFEFNSGSKGTERMI